MKRYTIILGAILLSVQGASASDMTGALVLIPIAGGVVGLVIGAVICIVVCSRRRGRRAVWFSLPIYGVAGFVVSVAALNIEMSKYEDKVVCSFGRYDRMRGGMGVITVPQNFSGSDLEQFYRLLTNRENAILSSHEFAAALVHQGNGIDQVYLNVYPSLDTANEEYTRINDEVHRQMEIVLKRDTHGSDTRK
jgi:hypothetical protein